jgi:hypothetical protein
VREVSLKYQMLSRTISHSQNRVSPRHIGTRLREYPLQMIETLRIDDQRRFHPSRELFEKCGLETRFGKTVFFWGVVRQFGQIQVLPSDSELSKMRDSLSESVMPDDSWETGNDDRTRIDRQLHTFLKVKCEARSKDGKVQTTFYAEAVDQGHLAADSFVVVTAVRKVFEVWSKENWQRFARIPNLRQLTAEARLVLSQHG